MKIDLEKTIQKWVIESEKAVHGFLPLLRPFFQTLDNNSIPIFVLGSLSTSCHLTTDSAILLIQNNSFWDAEILIRSVLEGTCKFLYLCSGTPDERQLKAKEYWEFLPDIAQIRRQARIQTFLDLVDNPLAEQWRPFQEILLPDDEIESLRKTYPRKIRQRLAQRWSLIPLIESLTTSETPGYKYLAGLMYSYGISSHLIHQDGDSIGLRWDRQQRDPVRKAAVELAHGARELGDLLTMALLRVNAAYRSADIDPSPIFEYQNTFSLLLDEINQAHQIWHEVEYHSNTSDNA